LFWRLYRNKNQNFSRNPVSLDANGVITGDPSRVTQAVYACVILMVMMLLGALLLLASPYISYKLAFGQVFEAISTTAS